MAGSDVQERRPVATAWKLSQDARHALNIRRGAIKRAAQGIDISLLDQLLLDGGGPLMRQDGAPRRAPLHDGIG